MIYKFVTAWEAHKADVRATFQAAHPDNYKAIVTAVVKMLHDALAEYGKPDPARVHEIDDGDYQGTLLFVIGDDSYQPSTYWYVKVEYGSCSGCDTLQAITEYSSDPPTAEQVEQYMTLALHVLQGLKEMGGDVT